MIITIPDELAMFVADALIDAESRAREASETAEADHLADIRRQIEDYLESNP